ncbi:hypothetical protein KP79_PYT03532 [Mizuhopecten yessoensis]|uniref:Uncharacterized protein n=1 Tax=Mizuhopecten yessoensis TaxID=6573 RepID=A0A210R4D4_MIZYE|nr:hypothetical protein KP79_PYT03532 [Mizuhopecten yessoensis]
MGEFKMAFNTIVTRDIKHIYSGFPQNIPMRYSNPYPTMAQMRLREENQDLKSGVLRFSDYDEMYGCLIPRAPAFRSLSRHEIEDMIERLRRPTLASKGICNTSDDNMVRENNSANPKYRGTKTVSEDELTGITQRLSKPTTISEIRRNQIKTKLADVSV